MNRCEHGVYLPDGQIKAWGCQGCYPDGHPEAEVLAPVFNYRGSLRLTGTGHLPKCPKCNVPVALSEKGCVLCGLQFDIDIEQRLRANNKQTGICPVCGSGVHFETSNAKVWKCADCGEEYPAGRRGK